MDILSMLFGSGGMVLSKEQKEKLQKIESEAYLSEAEKLAKQRGISKAKRDIKEVKE